ncbi:hypothetical protein ACU4GD_30560 [Cupriavidus basilensis]
MPGWPHTCCPHGARCIAQPRAPPHCPRCGAHKNGLHDGTDEGSVPFFHCGGCRQRFTRLTGTPMARLRLEDKAETFFQLASQQVSVAEAAALAGDQKRDRQALVGTDAPVAAGTGSARRVGASRATRRGVTRSCRQLPVANPRPQRANAGAPSHLTIARR